MQGTTRGKRKLARHVKPWFEASPLTIEQTAEVARCSRQTVSRLLAGTHRGRWGNVLAMLTAWGAPAEVIRDAQAFWDVADVDVSSLGHIEGLQPVYRQFRVDEVDAECEETLDGYVLPGLLQRPRYSAAMVEAQHRLTPGEGWMERTLAERAERQRLLTRANPLTLRALIDEAVIRRVVGGRDVMVDQLDALVDAASADNVSLRVIPFSVGGYGGEGMSIQILRFADPDEPATGYADALPVGLKMLDDVDALAVIWADAAGVALSESDSVALIREVRDALT
ncbi:MULTISPECIES: DUF5753 domain-containing protein [Saccharothrix]|uniref:DUF5753 domain-containing protein n=1 Tax=Saccharothrix TaxID=2071 RepID=UPI001161168F|nr:DUF5753 domain-containing protein [Saccharothrix sp. CB00851]